jgi:RNA 2',3'-cyclic 3'-phosphodiesterase
MTFEQRSLPGFEAEPHQKSPKARPEKPRPTDGFFFALRPDESEANAFDRLAWRERDKLGLSGWPLAKHRFHSTLLPLGGYFGRPEGLVEVSCQVAATIERTGFNLQFDRVGSYARKDGVAAPLVASLGGGLAGFMGLQQALRDGFEVSGLKAPQYTPHVTLLYDHRHVEPYAIEPISWTVREFVLIHSLIGRSQHIVLGRWRLRD